MDGLDSEQSTELRRQIQSLILATDIARQHEFLTTFQVSFPFSFLFLVNLVNEIVIIISYSVLFHYF